MHVLDLEQDSEEWLEFRRPRIGGSSLKDIYAKRGARKLGSYQLIAARIAQKADDENFMDRGHRLEVEAVQMLGDVLDIEFDTKPGVWVSDENEFIYISPDAGWKNEKGKYTKAAEVKALNSARQIQAIIENEIPDEYHTQVIQYFVVNNDLEILYFAFYDPRITARPLHVIEVRREDVLAEVVRMKEFEVKELAWVEEWTEKLVF